MGKSNLFVICLFTFLLFARCSNIEGDRVVNRSLEQISSFEFKDGRIFRLWQLDSLIYLSHAPQLKVSAYTLDGKHIKDYGKKGDALWENGSIWGFFKDKDGYWCHDYSKQQVKYFSIADSMQFNKEIISTNNIFHVKESIFVIPQVDKDNKEFYLTFFDVKNDSIIHKVDFRNFVPEMDKLKSVGVDYLFSGNFGTEIKNGKLHYYTNYTGFSLLVDTSTYEVTRVNDFRNIEFPQTKIENNRIILTPTKFVTLHSQIDENLNIYNLVTKDFSKKIPDSDFFIDVYDKDGKYKESISVPRIDDDFPLTFSKAKDSFILVYSNGKIVRFKAV